MQYVMNDGVVIRADDEGSPQSIQAWVHGAWTADPEIGKDWLTGLPISEAQAQALMAEG